MQRLRTLPPSCIGRRLTIPLNRGCCSHSRSARFFGRDLLLRLPLDAQRSPGSPNAHHHHRTQSMPTAVTHFCPNRPMVPSRPCLITDLYLLSAIGSRCARHHWPLCLRQRPAAAGRHLVSPELHHLHSPVFWFALAPCSSKNPEAKAVVSYRNSASTRITTWALLSYPHQHRTSQTSYMNLRPSSASPSLAHLIIHDSMFFLLY